MAFFSPAAISHLTAGRSQIGTSLSFHLFFAELISLCASAAGVSWPLRRRRRPATPIAAATAETATHRP